MALTYLEMQDLIKEALGNRTDKDDLIKSAINIAQDQVARDFRHEELMVNDTTSVVDTDVIATDQKFTMPTTLRKLYNLGIYEGTNKPTPLTGYTTEKWSKEIISALNDSRGMPRIFTYFYPDIYLYPVQDETYTITRVYSIWPTVLSADGDTSDLVQKDDLIILKAKIWVFNTLRMHEEANRDFRIYENLMENAVPLDNQPGIEVKSSYYETPYYPEPYKVPFKEG